MPTFTDPQTGDLNARTESSMSAIKYFNTPVEHTIVFNRRNGQEVNMGLSHIPGHEQELMLTIFNVENGEPIGEYEEIHLSLDEAKLLRLLLNRSEISAILMSQQQ